MNRHPRRRRGAVFQRQSSFLTNGITVTLAAGERYQRKPTHVLSRVRKVIWRTEGWIGTTASWRGYA
jgi:hypothetical protein